MFGFTPPPRPQPAPIPCPHCAHVEAIPLYATATTEYFQCVACKAFWSMKKDGGRAPAAA